MTASTEQFVDITKRGQDLVAESVRGWADTVQGLAQQFGGGRPQLPDAGAAVDRVFDFYEQVLSHQRELAKTVVGAGTSVLDQVTEQATRAAEAVGEQAGDSAEKVSEATAKSARAARPAGK